MSRFQTFKNQKHPTSRLPSSQFCLNRQSLVQRAYNLANEIARKCRFYKLVNRRSKAWTIVLLLLVCGALRAQEYSFRYFGVAEGLNNLTVRTAYQDRVGFLWVATVNGFYRYDGERFEAFGKAQGVPSSPGASFGDAPDGSLLAGGTFGLLRLRGDHFEKVPGPFKSVSELEGIQADGKGHTFINTERGLIELSIEPGKDGFAIRPIPPPEGTPETSVNGVPEAGALLLDGDSIWYGCGQELCHLEKGQTQVYGTESGLLPRAVVDIRKDYKGSLWLRLRSGGVYVLPAGQNIFRRPILPNPNQTLTGVPSTDAAGRVLLPLPGGMMMGDEQNWRKIDHTSGLRGAVYRTYEDRQHSLWICMAGRGIVQWRGYREWENYTSSNGLVSDAIHAILPQPNGPIWVATDGGLMRGERLGAGIQWNTVAGLEGLNVNAVREGPDGALWLATEMQGAARMDTRTGRLKWLSVAQGLIRSVFDLRFDRQRRLWVGTDLGLYVAQAPYQKFTLVSELPALRVRTVVEGTDGTIWAGGIGGLFSLTGGQWRIWTEADGMRSRQVLSLGVGTQGTIWVGYRFVNGMDRVHLQSNGLAIEKNVQRSGSDGIVYSLDTDAAGRMWAGSDHGVDMWDGVRWSHYGMSDGLIWDNCNQNAFASEPDGTVWIGTSGGLSRFKPSLRQTPEAPIKVVFTKLAMGGVYVSSRSYPSFDIHANTLQLRYSALNASRENAVVFRYRMLGVNPDWTETTQRELQFADLQPGGYRMEVEAQDSDGVWRLDGAEFSFRILTPWYRTWWFFALSGLVLLGGTWVVVHARRAEAKRKERDLQLLMEAHKTIENLAFYDPLTELPNRRMLLDRLRKSLAASARSRRLRAMLFVDLDQFKAVNDSFGHEGGDLLLQETAQRLTSSTREVDTVARLGGDEFVVMLEDLSEVPEVAAARAKIIAEKILAVISQPYRLVGHECFITSSIGITIIGNRQESADEVLRQADIAMYQAKAAGRNTLRFFEPALRTAVDAHAAMEEELRTAVREKQFLLYYEPQVDQGVLTGVEALLRWNHPLRSIVPHDEFIPLAEDTGLIQHLGEWALETICAQIAAWANRKETAQIVVSFNISARQFRQPDFVKRVLAMLDRSGANPKNLKLELNESMLVDNIDDMIVKITELKRHGLRFSLDDFGTGYSSLSYLRRLPLDQLKIDRSFVHNIFSDVGSGAIVQTIIVLSQALGLPVIAEGVETEEQRAFLANLGCHAYQGDLFSPPLPLDELEKLLAKHKNIA
jgi:diguanylate cyclase (GGDEF)-like protein